MVGGALNAAVIRQEATEKTLCHHLAVIYSDLLRTLKVVLEVARLAGGSEVEAVCETTLVVFVLTESLPWIDRAVSCRFVHV